MPKKQEIILRNLNWQNKIWIEYWIWKLRWDESSCSCCFATVQHETQFGTVDTEQDIQNHFHRFSSTFSAMRYRIRLRCNAIQETYKSLIQLFNHPSYGGAVLFTKAIENSRLEPLRQRVLISINWIHSILMKFEFIYVFHKVDIQTCNQLWGANTWLCWKTKYV